MKSDTRTKPAPVTNNGGDHERFAHYVQRPEGYRGSAGAYITDAIVNGFPLKALCGKVWIPSRDPRMYPVCPECADLEKAIRDEINFGEQR
jgi:hypothetical protein